MDTDTLTVTTEARGPLRQNLKLPLLPTPKLILPLMLGTDTTAMVLDTMVMVLDTMVDTTDTLIITDTITLERGLQKPMPNLGDTMVILTDTDIPEDITDPLMA